MIPNLFLETIISHFSDLFPSSRHWEILKCPGRQIPSLYSRNDTAGPFRVLVSQFICRIRAVLYTRKFECQQTKVQCLFWYRKVLEIKFYWNTAIHTLYIPSMAVFRLAQWSWAVAEITWVSWKPKYLFPDPLRKLLLIPIIN